MSTQPPPEDGVFVERLGAEVEAWMNESLIDAGTARIILARYGLVPGESAGSVKRSKIVSIVTVLAAVLIGIGVNLVMGSNWEIIPKYIRVALLIGGTLALYIAGYRLAFERRSYPKVGMALLLLGSILWGASILLIGQMYGLGGEGGEQTALLYWLAGVLPLAYVLGSTPHMFLSLLIGTVWLVWNQSDNTGVGDSLLFPHLTVIAALLYSLGVLHSRRASTSRFEGAYRGFALAYLVVSLYALSFPHAWGYQVGLRPFALDGERVWFAVLAAALAVAILVMISRPRGDRAAAYESAACMAVSVISGLTVALFLRDSPGYAYSSGWLWPMLFNVPLLAVEVGVIALGWWRNAPGLINLGLLVFVIHVVTRYFDLLGGLLSGGVFFIGAGVLLLAIGATIERLRRRLVSSSSQREALQ